MAHGYEYGNARLRARRGALLGAEDRERLLERDAEGQLAVLVRTSWRRAVEEASTRTSGLRCVQEAARRHLAREAADVRRLYEDGPRAQVDALLASWDRRNLLTVLRSVARGRPSEEALSAVVPVGALGESALRELLSAQDVKGVVDRLVALGHPAGRALLAAFPAFGASGALAVLERALVVAFALELEARRGALDPLVALALGWDLARDEVVLAVRLRAARESGEELVASPEWTAGQDLPGGRLRGRDLWDVVRAVTRQEAARVLVGRIPEWTVPLRAWVEHGSLETLAMALDRDLHERRESAWVSADPLGPGPVVAYLEALDADARDVRVIAAGRAAGLTADAIRPSLWGA